MKAIILIKKGAFAVGYSIKYIFKKFLVQGCKIPPYYIWGGCDTWRTIISIIANSWFSIISYGIEQVKHCYSKEYAVDDEKNLMLLKIYDAKFYNELFTYFKMDEVRTKEMLDCLLSSRMSRS